MVTSWKPRATVASHDFYTVCVYLTMVSCEYTTEPHGVPMGIITPWRGKKTGKSMGNFIRTIWLVVYCRHSKQEPNQETGDSSTTQISPATTSEKNHAQQSNGVYAEIEATQPKVDDLYYNVASQKNNCETPSAVIYSELQREDNGSSDHTVSPSGDMYARVQKR